ncbi:hypothetical protein F5B21DRAFT_499837 [Xylaria acuta]|nr:hypothetical protein F5B21DRAFT_499837 [Xylaria acuta]
MLEKDQLSRSASSPYYSNNNINNSHNFIASQNKTITPKLKKPKLTSQMAYHPNTSLFDSIMHGAPASKSHFSTTTSHRATSTTTTSTPTQNPGFLRRLASTPRGRASLAAAVMVSCVVDYELWTLYGAKYFGKGE